jgi:hypothetical protein
MIQDRVTLCVDFGYRLANVNYDHWSVRISDTGEVVECPGVPGSSSRNRLDKDRSYVGHAFLDWAGTYRRGLDDTCWNKTPGQGGLGPSVDNLEPVNPADLGIDLSGIQFQIGLRLYLF